MIEHVEISNWVRLKTGYVYRMVYLLKFIGEIMMTHQTQVGLSPKSLFFWYPPVASGTRPGIQPPIDAASKGSQHDVVGNSWVAEPVEPLT